jgi:hypothetical protein
MPVWRCPLVLILFVALGSVAAAEPEAPDAGADARTASDGGVVVSSGNQPKSLAESLSPWFASVIGGVGSAAYLIALWVGLVGSKDGNTLGQFAQRWLLKIPLFVASGGAVAMVFQLPEGCAAGA